MKKKLLFLLIFLLTLNLFSQDFSIRLEQLKIENQNCLDTGTSMQRCALNYYSKSDRLLNVVYKHIQENLSSLEKENLKQEQLSWLKSKDEKFSEISNQNTGHGNGLDDLMIKNHKKAEVINIRTKHLISKFLDKNKTVISKAEFIKIVPKNYSILDTVSGDLNRDEFLDYILVLKKNNEENTSNFMDDKQELRPLILLVGNSKNELTKVGQNDTTVLCYDCGGAMGEYCNFARFHQTNTQCRTRFRLRRQISRLTPAERFFDWTSLGRLPRDIKDEVAQCKGGLLRLVWESRKSTRHSDISKRVEQCVRHGARLASA